MKIKVSIPQLNHLKHEFIYAICYCTFNNEVRLVAYQPSGIYHLPISAPSETHRFRSYDSVIMQFAERSTTHDVLTYTAVIPIINCLTQEIFVVKFFDAVQNRDQYKFNASCSCERDEGTNLSIDQGISAEELFVRFTELVNEYKEIYDAALAGFSLVRSDLEYLIFTTFVHRTGLNFPNVAFFNISRDPPLTAYVLNYLLRMGCHALGISLSNFEDGCKCITKSGKSLDEIAGCDRLMKTTRQAIDWACCFLSIMTPYAYDTFVNGKDASIENTERFSNMRVPSKYLENSGADCEEDGKQNGSVLYYMKHSNVEDGDERFPFLTAVRPALKHSLPASSLMLVKSANVAEACQTDVLTVPVDKTTGHMCGLHIYREVSESNISVITLDDAAAFGVETTTFLEGTGAVRSNIEPYTPAVEAVYKSYQARIAGSPLHGFRQRPNMTRHDGLALHNAMRTPNNFYVVVDTVYPIHTRSEDAAVYLMCNDENKRGAAVSDIVMKDGGAYLKRLPDMSAELKSMMDVMIDFQCPEFPVDILPVASGIIDKVIAQNALLKKGDVDDAYCHLSFMQEFHKITDDCWTDLTTWINAQDDVVVADVECFGEIFRTPVVIVRLFFKMQ